jgi:hypothetical protein
MAGHASDPADRPELTAVADALRHLAPAPAGLDRDTLLFRAGQCAAPRRWFWPAAATISTAACAVLAVLLASRPAPAVVERIVYVERPVPPVVVPKDQPPAPQSDETSVPPEARAPAGLTPRRRLEEHLLRWGLDGLGEPPPPPDRTFMPPLFLSPGEVTP